MPFKQRNESPWHRKLVNLADAMESLCGQFQKTGALLAIRRFMQLHAQGNPGLDILDAAKTLRAYAVCHLN